MLTSSQLEQKIQRVCLLDHARCKAELLSITRPRLDFTEGFLDQQSLDHLRHILVAAYVQAAKSARGRKSLS